MESEWKQSKKRFWFVMLIMGRDGVGVECGPCVVVRKIFLFWRVKVLMLLGECVGFVCYWWILGQMVVGEEGDVEVCVLWWNVL